MKTVKDFSNPLLKRREIELVLQADSNPGFGEVKKKIAEHSKVDENLVVVKKLKGSFGAKDFFVKAFIYENVNDKEAIEPKVKKTKKPTEAAG